jgi:polyhydroxybutyrate depolymerase
MSNRCILRAIFFHALFILLTMVSGCGGGDSGPVDPLENRSYLLHVPPYYDGVTKMPLVIVLHGSGATAVGMESFTGFSAKADEKGFIVAYPQGNAGRWDVFGDHDVDFIKALIDSLAAQYAIDTLRVFVTGHSLGAILAYRVALRLPEKIAAVAPVSGVMFRNAPRPRAPVAVMHFHGFNDGALFYNGGAYAGAPYYSVEVGLAQWCQINGCDAGPITIYQTGDVIGRLWTSPTHKEVVLFAGNWGHDWPARVTVNQSTTDLMWDFFSTHGK